MPCSVFTSALPLKSLTKVCPVTGDVQAPGPGWSLPGQGWAGGQGTSQGSPDGLSCVGTPGTAHWTCRQSCWIPSGGREQTLQLPVLLFPLLQDGAGASTTSMSTNKSKRALKASSPPEFTESPWAQQGGVSRESQNHRKS